jgi:NADPH-dependent curcumin reductase CurA
MEAFIVVGYLSRATEAYAQIAEWVQQGRLRHRVELVQGLEQAPAALGKLFDGSNLGKLLVQVETDPDGAVKSVRGAGAGCAPD